jgi:hypothetical protein
MLWFLDKSWTYYKGTENDSVAKSSEGRELAELRRFFCGDAEQLAADPLRSRRG